MSIHLHAAQNPRPAYAAVPKTPEGQAETLSLPEDPGCGLVLFDDPKEGLTGSAYLAGEPVRRIRSTNDLPNDVLWISNLTALDERTREQPNLRSGYYFRVSLIELSHDLGLPILGDAQMDPDAAQLLAQEMSNTVRLAAALYGDTDPLDWIQSLRYPFIHSDVGRKLARSPDPDPRHREALTRAWTQSQQDISVPDWPNWAFEPNAVYVTLRFNRLHYAHQLLSMPVPGGRNWVRIEGALGETLKDEMLTRPVLVRAKIEWDDADSDAAALAAVGRTGKSRGSMRHWFAQPELAWLARVARPMMTGFWLDESPMRELPPKARLPAYLTGRPEVALSFAAGMVAHMHLQAMMAMSWNRKARAEEASLWSSWIRAMDRAHMHRVAVRAHEAGLHVDRYGMGSLRLRLRRDQWDDMLAFREKEGFFYPSLAALEAV